MCGKLLQFLDIFLNNEWLIVNLYQDEDPYVRKTAAVSVAKLHDINAGLVEEQGFLDSLKVELNQFIVYSKLQEMYRLGTISNAQSLYTFCVQLSVWGGVLNFFLHFTNFGF